MFASQFRIVTRLQRMTALTLCAGLLSLQLCGCAPPTPGTDLKLPDDGGKPILNIHPDKHPPHQTVEIDGEELMVARGEVGQFGGTFIENQIGDGPRTFNGWAAKDATSSMLADMMLSGLVQTDAYTGDVIPLLAKSVTLADDKMTYRVVLRKGLKWSDGKPLTADDVVFTWRDIIAKGLGNASSRDVNLIDGQFPEVTKVDDLTVTFKTAKPFAPFMRNLSAAIAPRHLLAGVVAQGNNAFSAFWGTSDATNHPGQFISSNMWLLERYEPGQRAVFKRNPHFYMVDQNRQRLPYLDKYVINFVGDMNNQQLQFEQGKSDVYSVPGKNLTLARQLKKPAFNLYNLGPATGTTFLTFNLNTRQNPATHKPLVNPVRSAWFTNLKFRQAVDYAINREDMVVNILKGVGAPLFTAESLASIFLNKQLAAGHPQNLDKARALLKEGGFTWNKAGQLLDAQGNKVEFSLYTNTGNDEREATGVNIVDDLAKVGITVNFKPMDFNVLIGKIDDGGWEAIILGLTGGPLEPHGGANVWKSDGSLHMFNQRVISPDHPVDLSDRLPWEKEIDDLFDEGIRHFDFKERRKIYDRVQEIAYEQLPFIYLYSPLSIQAVRKRIQNYDPTPLGSFHNMEEIWIDEGAEKR
ncbi:MAG: ABC transporter substrate-binding protein [Candidatus Melainabacteria bacterium]